MTKPLKIGSRTDTNPTYRQVNKAAMERRRFMDRAAWQYVLTNYPAVATLIQDEAYKRFPVERKKPNRDFRFLDDIPKS